MACKCCERSSHDSITMKPPCNQGTHLQKPDIASMSQDAANAGPWRRAEEGETWAVFLARIACTECEDVVYYHRCSVVCVCMSLSVGNNHELCQTAELIEMPLGMWTRVAPRNHVLAGGPDIPREGGIYLWMRCCFSSKFFDRLLVVVTI